MSWGLGNFGEGLWGVGGQDSAEIVATSSVTAQPTRIRPGFATINSVASLVGIGNFDEFGLAESGFNAHLIVTVSALAGRPIRIRQGSIMSMTSTAGGSGQALLAWDGIDDVTTTWTQIEIV
tara:strand:+ start:607 stop:972 length:366 start_codon:yes stop_codon:yes gene_type:complete